ncbi:MFS transporter [Rhizomicrobium electricum]|uniref:MFS transporter n=1 Tax=Rhizomicrobium electricum TaxID=480070 RepID=A0ABP3QAT5_9PROT|nr:MFS transporter [Rhizomicrobium electricum]NIJ50726.1 MFS family permease [Rhizomicrobium electricum]
MAYFGNRTINLLNLHYAIHSIAMTGGGAFFAAYLVKADVPIPGVFASFAAILIGRFLIRPAILGLAVRYGMRRLIILGTLLNACQFPFLGFIHGPGLPLYAMIAIGAIADTLYWPCYHAYFARLGDDDARGQQIGVREAIAAMIGVVSPLLTGILLVTFGPQVAFGVSALAVAGSALPLLYTPHVPIVPTVPHAYRDALPGILLFVGDGFIGGIYLFVWQVALFLALNQNFLTFGGALAIAAVVGAAAGMVLGRHIDDGNGKRAVTIAYGILSLIVVLRAMATLHPALAVTVNALSAIGNCLYIPTLMAVVYTLAKAAPCSLRFHIATEAGWDAGGATSLLTAALLAWFHVPLWAVLLLGLAGTAWQITLLRRHYAQRDGAQPATAT